MADRFLKVFVGLTVLALVLFVGAVVGGAVVYGLTQLDLLPVDEAQAVDPGYGVVIASVETDSPAADAGLVRGDILLEIDGIALEQMLELAPRLDDYGPGDEVELTVLHGDDLRTLRAVFGEGGDQAYLGVAPCGSQTRTVWRDQPQAGAVISEVMPDSPAEEAGLETGDVILAVDSTRLDGDTALVDVIAEYEPGDLVTLEVEKPDTEPRKLRVELGENPEKAGVAYLGVRYGSTSDSRGFGFALPPSGHLEDFGFGALPFELPPGGMESGLVILHVADGSPASDAGLMAGDTITAIEGKEVASREELEAVLAEREPADMISLTIGRVGTSEEGVVDVILGENPDEEGKPYLGVTIWPLPRLGSYEGEYLPFRKHEGFGSDQLPFVLPEGGRVQGAVIRSVAEGSPASAAGLKEEDVIRAIDGKPLESAEDLVLAIADREPGDEIKLTVLQGDGELEREIQVTLGEHPDEEGKAYLGVEIGAYLRIEGRWEHEGQVPFGRNEWPFHLELPLDKLPFELDKLPHRFDFRWAPGEDGCDGSPGCSGDSV